MHILLSQNSTSLLTFLAPGASQAVAGFQTSLVLQDLDRVGEYWLGILQDASLLLLSNNFLIGGGRPQRQGAIFVSSFPGCIASISFQLVDVHL